MLKAPWQWVSSPLGFNVLLSMLKENSPTVEKYSKIAKTLENNQGCNIKNKVFVSSSKQISVLGQFMDIEKADFSQEGNKFMDYINKYGDLKNHEFTDKTESVYTNVCTFESLWQLNKRRGLSMKIYNSFNYADDIRYDGRLMELPLRSEDFKLVLVLWNENDWLVNSLFATLANQGLAAAVDSIQPLFVAETALSTPLSIDVNSRVLIKEKISSLSNGSAVQYGTITLSDEGTRVKVLTCIYSPEDTAVNNIDDTALKSGSALCSVSDPFYFAVVYQDTPIFYGDFKRNIGDQNN